MGRLDGVRQQLARKTARVGPVVAEQWQTALRARSPVGSGRLRSETTVTHQTGLRRVVWTAVADTDYAEAVVRGAQPHVIRPVRAKALRFHWPKAGKVVYFAKVNHPGNPPNPYWDEVNREIAVRVGTLWPNL